MRIDHVNPDTLHRNPAFTQIVKVEGAAAMAYVGGQNAVDATGAIVGDDLRSQAAQALRNVIAALAAVGATPAQVVRLGIYIVQDGDIREAFAAAQDVWGPHPTAIIVLRVAGLGNPRFLVEIEATAAIPPS